MIVEIPLILKLISPTNSLLVVFFSKIIYLVEEMILNGLGI